MSESSCRLTIIVPMLDARSLLEASLPPLLGLGDDVELIVVDDGSEDGSADFARAAGATVLPSGGRALGPARARNVGVAASRGDVIVFVDADVVAGEGAIEGLVRHVETPGVVAAYGSYDDEPAERGLVSAYANLRHHHFHRAPLADSPSFWSGLGAVDRVAYLAVGGFDVERFPRPSVEDIDLGRRLRVGGERIVRDPELQGTHLKRWTARDLLRTDILRRAWPWARMMAAPDHAFDDLNVAPAERLKAVLAGLALLAWIATLAGLAPVWVPLGLWAVGALADRTLLGLFMRRGGPLLALFGFLWHQAYYLYSSVTFVLATLSVRLSRGGGA